MQRGPDLPMARDRRFESTFPQGWVRCEPRAPGRRSAVGVSRGASTGSYAIALPSRQQIVHRRLGQGRFRAGGLSSFRTYPARLSAGYRGFRSGENESSLGKRPRFPTAPDFPQTLLTSGRPVPPNRAPFSCRSVAPDRMCWCAGNARAARCADKPNAGLSCCRPCRHGHGLNGHGLRGIRADRRTLPRPDRRHRLRASRYSRRRLYVRLSARARLREGRSATPACPGGQTGTSHALLIATGTSLPRCP